MPEDLSTNGIRLSILSRTRENTRWSFSGLWPKRNQKFRAQKLPGLNVKGSQLAKSKLFYGFYHALKSYHEIHDDKEEILGDEILDLYDSYNLQNSYDF